MESWLKCKVSPGQFSIEYAVQGEAFDGSKFSLFAPADSVEFDNMPSDGTSVEGRIRVIIEGKKSELLLIRLPRQTMENGQHITVRTDQIDSIPSRQEA